MKKIIKPLIVILAIFGIALYYYIYLPVINIHSQDVWVFVISIIVIATFLYKILNTLKFKEPNSIVLKSGKILIGILVLVFIVGKILSSPIVNAKKYQALINIETGDFKKDIKQISYNEIPILDKQTAINLGSRKMGGIAELVSQFEVDNLYTQINYKEKPVRVTPLRYGNLFKWFTNRKEGIPAYMRIDMATQNVDLIKLKEGIKYSFSEPLNRNVNRHLRFNYPTYIFDEISFEINDDAVPYWICPVRDYTIGLFGGPIIKKVVFLNAITGELTEYKVNEVPRWVDNVYSAKLLVNYYNYYGTLKNGFLNSVLAQKDVLRTTEGYNYIALNDDVYLYTGITSVTADKSNVGFVLMNKRTAETKYYEIAGAQETSAMASAEGQVQNLGYISTFPLLLNIVDEPTYFMALKDSAGLVKKYAMVNIEKYQIVAVGDTILECENDYKQLLSKNNIRNIPIKTNNINGNITLIKDITIDGNTNIVLKVTGGGNKFFKMPVKNNINILNYKLNDKISFEYVEENKQNIITKIK